MVQYCTVLRPDQFNGMIPEQLSSWKCGELTLWAMDKSIAAVNTAVHRSKLTIAAVTKTLRLLGWRYGGGDGGGVWGGGGASSNIITYSVIAARIAVCLYSDCSPNNHNGAILHRAAT